MKKIVFFDGDGTLWYPKKTKRTVKPFWVYLDKETRDNFLEHLILVPEAIETLSRLKVLGIKLVILSTHPDKMESANASLKNKVLHFKLQNLFDKYFATAEYPEAKAEKILEMLGELGMEKQDALMVGDSYRWDIEPVVNIGVDAALFDSQYHQEHIHKEPAKLKISEISEVIGLVRLLK